VTCPQASLLVIHVAQDAIATVNNALLMLILIPSLLVLTIGMVCD
jgi:hypothetical protein